MRLMATHICGIVDYIRQPESLTLPQVLASLTPAQTRFFEALDVELEKVNSFYEERKTEAVSRYATISLQTEQYLMRHSNRKVFRKYPI